jgi:hypothetical protein
MPYLVSRTPTNGYSPRNRDLASCLLVSRTFHDMTLSTLYSCVSFETSAIFAKFHNHLCNVPEVGQLVRRLDFSKFTSIGLGRSQNMNMAIHNLTATTLFSCLNVNPHLREFLASESIDSDIDETVLAKVFFDLPRLDAIDFCGCTKAGFWKAITAVISSNNPRMPEVLNLTKVGFHGCNTIPPSVYATFIPRLPHVTRLDLTHTQITDGSLHALPSTARLTHLSLSKCNKLQGPAVVDFLVNHPAVKNLVWLNLHFDTSRYRLLSTDDVDVLLPRLPRTLASLNIGGAKINRSHIPAIRRLSEHLEELSLANADLPLEDINSLFRNQVGANGHETKPHRSNLKYLDLTGVSSVSPASLLLGDRDSLLRRETFPLRVLELSGKVLDGLKERKIAGAKLGWNIRNEKRRGWCVRDGPGVARGGENISRAIEEDDCSRPWKFGGKSWGNRKVGMAYGEICGLYGYYGLNM